MNTIAFSRAVKHIAPSDRRETELRVRVGLIKSGRAVAEKFGVRYAAELFAEAGVPLQIALLVLVRRLPTTHP